MTTKLIVSFLLTVVFGGLGLFIAETLYPKSLGATIALSGMVIGYYLLFMYLTWTK